MNEIIVGSVSGEIDVKRFYMPDITIIGECPNCNSKVTHDFEDHYLSYPVVGAAISHSFSCEKCNHEWECKLMLKVELSIVKD